MHRLLLNQTQRSVFTSCCFCQGCSYELCRLDALVWTTSISLLIGHLTLWTGHSSTERPRDVSIHTPSARSRSQAELCLLINVNLLGLNINHWINDILPTMIPPCVAFADYCFCQEEISGFWFSLNQMIFTFQTSFYIFDTLTAEQNFCETKWCFF